MEQYSDDEQIVKVSNNVFISDDDAAEKLGLTDLQRKYADNRVAGCNQTQSARLAGYSGEGARLRSTASEVERSVAVQSYISWKRSGSAGIPDDPASREEIKRRLSRMLRNDKDRSTAIRAAEVLHRINAFEAEQAGATAETPTAVLDEMAKLGPIGVGLALWLSRMTKVAWKPPVPATDGVVGAFEAALREQLTPEERARVEGRIRVEIPLTEPETSGERARRKYVKSVNTDPSRNGIADAGHAGRSQEAPSPAVRPAVGPSEAPESWLRDGGHPAHVAGALTREQAQAAAALMKRRK